MTNFKLHKSKFFNYFTISLLIIVFLFGSCDAKREIVNTDELVKISQPRVFGNTFKNGLYKTDMQIHEHELTGLMFFNKKDKSMRVVMLSEVGFKYFDIEYILGEPDPFTIHQVTDFLNHDKFIGSIQNFLSLVMINVDEQHQTYKDNQAGFLLREVEKENNKTLYHYNSNSGAIDEITQNGSKKVTLILSDYDYLSPGSILYHQRKIHYSLKKVEKE